MKAQAQFAKLAHDTYCTMWKQFSVNRPPYQSNAEQAKVNKQPWNWDIYKLTFNLRSFAPGFRPQR